MCCHRLYVYGNCGHTLFAPNPIVRCSQASITPDGPYSARCEIVAHPFQSWKIESLCPECNKQRSKRLSDIEQTQKIKFDDWKWKVSYGMPAYGKDFWGRKAEERERLEKEAGKKKRRSGPMLDKSSIIWISVLSAFALGCFIFALWMVLRGRCCRRRKNKKQANGHRYHPSLQMKDGRNEFEAWNKSEGRVDSAMSVLPPTSTAVQPAGFAHPGNPVIVDEIPPQPVPMYGRNNKERYYSGLSNSLKRFSSIGKAY